MQKIVAILVTTIGFTLVSSPLMAAEVCTVSMMGRVCFEEGSPEATAAHMKGDAVAVANAQKKKTDVADASKDKK